LAEPGGVCISGSAYDQVENKLALGYDYLGEQAVKNIKKPVRVYRVRIKNQTSNPDWSRITELPDRPSIAVLPFVNMSGDPEQEYFSDGMTEDLITDLSKVSNLFVIARNSAFTYKGKAVKVEQASQELGVRYVLEGSVRKAGGRVRITAQLVDGTTGGHLWAERYDRDLSDIFTVQDEVTEKIIAALRVKMEETEAKRVLRKGTENLKAYDYVLRGRAYVYRCTRDGFTAAREMFTKALELDPEYAGAYVGLGWISFNEWSMQLSQDPKSLDQAIELAKKAIALDSSLPSAYSLSGHAYLWKKQYEQAITENQIAIALDPNDADNYDDLAEILTWTGRPEEAIGWIAKAMRLNPHYPTHYLSTLGFAYFRVGQYQEAISALKRALLHNPDLLAPHILLAIILGESGRMEEARAEAAEILRINPGYSLEVMKETIPSKDEERLEACLGALRKAGIG
jgi:adenylate cyclase